MEIPIRESLLLPENQPVNCGQGYRKVQPIQPIGFKQELKLLYMPVPARIQPVRAARNPHRKIGSIIGK
jgi:hypothetical protein